MTIIASHLIISGRVQGVFYRNWTVATARTLGLAGWVRNRLNGDVEALVQGDPAAVAHFVTLAWQGPPAARVDAIAQTPADIGEFDGFAQRATA